MSMHTITAVFDTRPSAEQAMAQLRSSGVPASDITSLPAAGENVTSAGTGGGKGFWGSLEQLFGGSDDQATYAESIRRGGIMVSVRAEDDRLDHVIDILEQHGSVDLDEREAGWRQEGWTGGSSVAGTRITDSSSAMAGSRGLALDDPGMTALDSASANRAGATTPGLGTLGAGALGAGAGVLGTTAYEERRDAAATSHGTVAPAAAAYETATGRTVTDRAVGDRATVPASTGGIAGKLRDAADDVIQIVEERLDVGKRSVSRGKVRVHTSVVSREVSEDVTLHGESVSVDRRAVDRPVSATAFDSDPFRERTIEMEEFAEEAVVAKSAHVVEEIGIHKEAADRVETVHETLRSTKVDIDDARTGGVVAGSADRFAVEMRDDMEVVGSDGIHVGTIDHMDGNRIKLKKADVAAGGEHHYLTRDLVQSVGDKVMLAVTAADAKARWATI